MSPDFLQGFAVAAATLARNFGEGKLVEQILICNGITLKQIIDASAERFDTRAILGAISGRSKNDAAARGCSLDEAQRLTAE